MKGLSASAVGTYRKSIGVSTWSVCTQLAHCWVNNIVLLRAGVGLILLTVPGGGCAWDLCWDLVITQGCFSYWARTVLLLTPAARGVHKELEGGHRGDS